MIAQTEQSFVDLQLIRLHDINNINIILDHARSCLASPRRWFDIVFIHKIQTAPQRQIKRFEKFCCRPVDEPATVRSCVLNLKSREYSTRYNERSVSVIIQNGKRVIQRATEQILSWPTTTTTTTRDRCSLTLFRHSTTMTRLVTEASPPPPSPPLQEISWLKFVLECWPSGVEYTSARWLALALRRGAGVSLLDRSSNRDRTGWRPPVFRRVHLALCFAPLLSSANLPPVLVYFFSPSPSVIATFSIHTGSFSLLRDVFQLHGSRATQNLRSSVCADSPQKSLPLSQIHDFLKQHRLSSRYSVTLCKIEDFSRFLTFRQNNFPRARWKLFVYIWQIAYEYFHSVSVFRLFA